MIRTLGVIPARLASTRLPRKVLRPIAGRPMLAWVFAAARACPQLDHLIVATDSEEVAALCRLNNWPVELTSPHLQSGSDRVHAVAQLHPAEIYVNIQGDEPLLRPEHLTALLRPFHSEAVVPSRSEAAGPPRSEGGGPRRSEGVQVTTLKVLCPPEDLANPNAVKVVTALNHQALYFSRASIPHHRDPHPDPTCNPTPAPIWKHLGLYAYRAQALARFHALPPSPLEQTERLEQLRFLENGIPIHVEPTPYDTIGVDTEQDLRRVEQLLLTGF